MKEQLRIQALRVRAGLAPEESDAPPMLPELERLLEATERLRWRIRQSLLSPRLVLSFLVVESVLGLAFLVPPMTRWFTEALPGSKALQLASSVLATPLPAVALLALAAAVRSGLRRRDALLVLAWLFRSARQVLRITEQIAWCRILSLFLREGLPLPEALERTAARLRDPRLASEARRLAEAVARGDTLARALEGLEWERALTWEVELGEEGEDLEDTLLEAADRLEAELSWSTDRQVALLGPLALLVVGVLATLVLLAFWQPYNSLILQLGH